MAQNNAITAMSGDFFDRDWSRIRGSMPRQRQKQMVRAASIGLTKRVAAQFAHPVAPRCCVRPPEAARRSRASLAYAGAFSPPA
ncbi:hypothetical protein BAR1_10865 [Profundibacter amoris]|uniref:Uncharacterized protein n=1 Tax=Profundibacter amoris TaxID=2171755 RepID=A0A347UHQ4_9RHOB|nr:hypothetical protein BAR1_10865 [Profundibacter amoris]